MGMPLTDDMVIKNKDAGRFRQSAITRRFEYEKR